MKATQHVPIERAIKFLVDATPLAAWEEQHLISCEECHQILMQAASDQLLKKEELLRTHIDLRDLWDHANYELDMTDAQSRHLETCEDCLTVLALCRIEKCFTDLERKVEEAGFFNDDLLED